MPEITHQNIQETTRKNTHLPTVMDVRQSLYMNITRRSIPSHTQTVTILEGRSLRTSSTASSKDMWVGWPPLDKASTMKRSMPHAAASSKKVMVFGGTAEMSEMYTSRSVENESDQDLCLRFEFKGPSGRVASSHHLLLFSQKSSTR